MRRCFIALAAAAAIMTVSGCSWYEAFCQRFGTTAASTNDRSDHYRQSRAAAEREEASEPD